MTFKEMFASLKRLYKQLMFPQNQYAPKWKMNEIDELDIHFFSDLLSEQNKPKVKQYINDVF